MHNNSNITHTSTHIPHSRSSSSSSSSIPNPNLNKNIIPANHLPHSQLQGPTTHQQPHSNSSNNKSIPPPHQPLVPVTPITHPQLTKLLPKDLYHQLRTPLPNPTLTNPYPYLPQLPTTQMV